MSYKVGQSENVQAASILTLVKCAASLYSAGKVDRDWKS